MDSQTLNLKILEIRKLVREGTSVESMFPEFREQYPKLFDMISKTDCDENILKNFINLQKKRESGKLTAEESDVAFGKVVANKYLPKE